MSKAKIKKLDYDIEKTEHDYQAFLEKQEQERAAADAQRTERVAALQAERDRLALEIKLKDYPDKVKKQKTCRVCGANMRPFTIARGDTVSKLWACSAGNLSDAHDLVTVE